MYLAFDTRCLAYHPYRICYNEWVSQITIQLLIDDFINIETATPELVCWSTATVKKVQTNSRSIRVASPCAKCWVSCNMYAQIC